MLSLRYKNSNSNSNSFSSNELKSIGSDTGYDDNNPTELFSMLSKLRIKNYNRIMVANINSLRNKFEMLSEIVANNLELLLISESKLDSSFSFATVLIPGFCKPQKLDRSLNGDGVMLFTRENITIKVLSEIPVLEKLELMFVSLSERKKKWFIGCSYNPSKIFIK